MWVWRANAARKKCRIRCPITLSVVVGLPMDMTGNELRVKDFVALAEVYKLSAPLGTEI
jgi:hypothetical protein